MRGATSVEVLNIILMIARRVKVVSSVEKQVTSLMSARERR
jgi:hypothetical protein